MQGSKKKGLSIGDKNKIRGLSIGDKNKIKGLGFNIDIKE